ncbi:MAG: pyridoxamine 5'-phosphate oxidase [Bacteroidales bacterium]
MIPVDIAKLRKEYSLKSLNEASVSKNPFMLFEQWLNEAIVADLPEPNAMTLATSSFEGKPSARVVLLKQFTIEGFSFFTNYESRKAKNLLQNPYAALVFYWSELERQVRVEGKVSKVNDKESDKYFNTRPEKSKIGAWASPQSKVIPSRRYLENLMTDYEEEFQKKNVVRPKNWGGYILQPSLVEFWQGRPNRLHDRIQYTFVNERWIIERLAP